MRYTHSDYTVAWICALPVELAAAKAVLDTLHPSLPPRNSDQNVYTLGSISGHNVAVACLPRGIYGTVSASHVVSQMRSTFPAIQFGLMVGIGGGVPSTGVDIRLGDVVISKPTGNSGGVTQYDYGKALPNEQFERVGSLNKPLLMLLTALAQMESDHLVRQAQANDILNTLQTENKDQQQFSRPSEDWLFQATYDHLDQNKDCSVCDHDQLEQRNSRGTNASLLHYGVIASGNQVIKDAKTRDSIAQEIGALCFEMEAAGFMDQLQPLVIRGICDYCDSHKNKKWQGYATLAAASYAKVLLAVIPAFPTLNVDTTLREYYQKKDCLTIKRLSGERLCMEQCYINLLIIQYKHSDQRSIDQTEERFNAFSLLSTLKVKADNPEKEVTLPELFNDRKQPNGSMMPPRRILIRGRAGVGKTTLCKKIVHDFLYQDMWANLYDRIIWIPLRRLKGMSRVDEYFCQELFSSQAEPEKLTSLLRKIAFDQTDQRTLWLLDGLDEVSGYRNSSGADLTEIFNSLLNASNVIITSRPYAANLPGIDSFDLELETIGFHSSQIDTYVSKAIHDQDMAEKIRSFIQKNWLIQGLVRIPIQLDALCYSWDSDFKDHELSQTMTAIYQAIELKLWKKDILQLEKQTGQRLLSEDEVRKLRTRRQIISLVGLEMKLLEFLAFTGLHNDVLEFQPDDRDQIYSQPQLGGEMSDDVLDKLSFLRSSDISNQDKSYHFLHLTFQEYFAAQYFVRCWTSESELICLNRCSRATRGTKISPAQFLQQEKYSGRYDVFWRFVTGLLHHHEKEQVCIFLQKIESEPRDLLGPAHQRLLMHCFSEIPSSTTIEDNDSSFQSIRETMEFGCIKWSHYELTSCKRMYLCSETEFPGRVVAKLLKEDFLSGNKGREVTALKALAYRSHISLSLARTILDYTYDDDWDVRRASVNVLGLLSSRPAEILQAITSRLDDNDWHVRQAAVDALSKQSSRPAEILQAITSRLDDNDWHVRQAAVDALSKQSPWPAEIFEAITRRLHDNDWDVRQAAVDALSTQSPWPAHILQAITSQLHDNDWQVRQAAINALGTQSPWPADILQAITSRLDHNDWHVREAAVNAVSTQSPWPADILQAITSRLDDNDWHVREAAVNAVSTQSSWPTEIFQAITSRLDDNDWQVWQAAVEALSTQSPWPTDILQAITSQLHDNDWQVRQAAVDALSTQSPWPADILQAITSRLDDNDWHVREAAVDALSTQSPWPAEIFQAITRRLDDDNDKIVRLAAVKALSTQSSWPTEIFQAITRRLDDNDWQVRRAAVNAVSRRPSWPTEIFQAITRWLDDDNNKIVRLAAVKTLSTQSPWPTDILQAITSRLDDNDWHVREAAVNAVSTRSPWPTKIFQAITRRLDDDNDKVVRLAAVEALGKQYSWPAEVFHAIIHQLDDVSTHESAARALGRQSSWPTEVLISVLSHLRQLDSVLSPEVETMLWNQDEFLPFLLTRNVELVPMLCKPWVIRSIHEHFACYVHDGIVHFETSNGRRSVPSCSDTINFLKRCMADYTRLQVGLIMNTN